MEKIQRIVLIVAMATDLLAVYELEIVVHNFLRKFIFRNIKQWKRG